MGRLLVAIICVVHIVFLLNGCHSSSAQGMTGITVERLDALGDARLFTPFEDGVLFFGYMPDTGYEPWFSDGTPEGTFQLMDINPGPATSWNQIHDFLILGDFAYFFADDSVHGLELWRTDGTTEGTYLFADLYPGAPGPLRSVDGVVAGNRIFLSVTVDADLNAEVWVITDHDVQPRVLISLAE